MRFLRDAIRRHGTKDVCLANGFTLSCAAKAHVPKPRGKTGCGVRAAISGARKEAGGVPPFQIVLPEGLQPRAEAKPRQLQRGVSQPLVGHATFPYELTRHEAPNLAADRCAITCRQNRPVHRPVICS